MNQTREGTLRGTAFDLMFGRSSRSARIVETTVLGAILLSVAVVMVDSVLGPGSVWSDRLRVAELAFTLLFTFEYLLRLWCHPQPSRYAFGFYGFVDFVSIMPTYLALLVPGWESLAILRVLRVLRIFRIFGLGRFSGAASIIGNALTAARYKIAVFVASMAIVVLVAGSLIYVIEGPERGFSSIPASAYWAIATLTIGGNADINPATVPGKVLASVLMMLGYAMIAVPVGVITSEVVSARKTREELLSGEETARREYKSSAFHDYGGGDLPETVLFHSSVIKPVAGFLNAKGGTLAIGIDDDGKVLGIEPDLDLKKWDMDRYVNALTSKMASELGTYAAALTEISIRPFEGRAVCVVDVQPSPDPVYVRTPKNPHTFYVRINNSTRELAGPDLVMYTKKRWD